MAAYSESRNKLLKITLLEECSDPGLSSWLQDSRNVIYSNNMLLTAFTCGEQRDPAAHVDGYVDVIVQRYTDRQFRDHFRMSRGTFELFERDVIHFTEGHEIVK